MRFRFSASVVMVSDIAGSRRFYEGVLGQKVMADHGENVVYVGGFSLWEAAHAARIIFSDPSAGSIATGSMNLELYFESDDLDAAQDELDRCGVSFAHRIKEEPWGQRTLRCYDPDGHLVEVAESMESAITRLFGAGCRPEEISKRTSMPMEVVLQAIGYPRFC